MGKVDHGTFRECVRLKDRLKGSLRRMFEAKSGVSFFATNLLLRGFKLLGALPVVGPFGNRWAGFIHAIRSEHIPAID